MSPFKSVLILSFLASGSIWAQQTSKTLTLQDAPSRIQRSSIENPAKKRIGFNKAETRVKEDDTFNLSPSRIEQLISPNPVSLRLLKSGGADPGGGQGLGAEFYSHALWGRDAVRNGNVIDFEQTYPEVDQEALAVKLKTALVVVVPQTFIYFNGQLIETDAKNYPKYNLIEVSEKRFPHLSVMDKRVVALHEYFGLMGLESSLSYNISSRIRNYEDRVSWIDGNRFRSGNYSPFVVRKVVDPMGSNRTILEISFENRQESPQVRKLMCSSNFAQMCVGEVKIDDCYFYQYLTVTKARHIVLELRSWNPSMCRGMAPTLFTP